MTWADWLLFRYDGMITSLVFGIIGGIGFAIGHETVKAFLKRIKGESWYAHDSTMDRILRSIKGSK